MNTTKFRIDLGWDDDNEKEEDEELNESTEEELPAQVSSISFQFTTISLFFSS